MLRELHFLIENLLDIGFVHQYLFTSQEAPAVLNINAFKKITGKEMSYSMPVKRRGSSTLGHHHEVPQAILLYRLIADSIGF